MQVDSSNIWDVKFQNSGTLETEFGNWTETQIRAKVYIIFGQNRVKEVAQCSEIYINTRFD